MVQAASNATTGYEMPGDEEIFIQLGFAEKPKNRLVTRPEFTPSKIGGDPAWIAPGVPEDQLVCEKCGTPFCFIAQLYSNLNHLPDYHRMLYVFACISPQCIKHSDSVRAFRCVNHDRNQFVTFATDADFNFCLDKTDASLMTSRYAAMYDNIDTSAADRDSRARGGDFDDDEDDESDDENDEYNEQQPAGNQTAATETV